MVRPPQSKSATIVILFLLFAGVSAFGWYKLQMRSIQSPDNGEPLTTTPSPSPDPTSDWQDLENSTLALRYPSTAEGESRDTELLVHFMGQKQIDSGRTQTELSDGYSVRAGSISRDPAQTLDQLATAEQKTAMETCHTPDGKVSSTTAVSIGAGTGFQFHTKGCGTDYTETLIEHQDQWYRITQIYVGDATDIVSYKKTSDLIFSTLRFI